MRCAGLNTPEEIWIDTIRGEDGFLAVAGADLPKSVAHISVGKYIRADLHEAALAAAKAEGVREGLLAAAKIVPDADSAKVLRAAAEAKP